MLQLHRNLCISLSLLILGGLIYLTCRQEILFLSVFGKDFLDIFKINIKYDGNIFVYFFLFCLPDMLWYMSLLIFQMQFYNKTNISSRLFLGAAIVSPFIIECLQYLNVLAGTFDLVDICAYLLTLVVFYVLAKLYLIKTN